MRWHDAINSLQSRGNKQLVNNENQTYTEECAKIMDFSQAHYEYRYTMIVKDELGNAPDFTSLHGKIIALLN
ncbi:MAG: hypothetical protein Q4B82_06635 [Alysiella sp.]|uniref:hypothetical protein n=1 Tax=Alysiella sp. TaxID=1872483 RepID=UPI0026DDAFC2|nr:hypothetical protein [Alysiella sp.]MDO4434239.1 hypothetical protein [Alysiella sp.]